MPPRSSRTVHWLLPALLGWLLSCNLDNPGDTPSPGTLYFPTAVQVSSGDTPRFLYVLNSNYDYRWSDGSLQAFDLDRIDERLAECEGRRVCYEDCIFELQTCNGTCGDEHPCPEDCMGDEECKAECAMRARCLNDCGSRTECESECTWKGDCSISTQEALVDEVLVPTHGTCMAKAPDDSRMYTASRTIQAMTYVDLDDSADGDGVLDCGAGRRCDADHQRGANNTESQRRTELPADPVAIIAGHRKDLLPEDDPTFEGDYVMLAHKNGAASLFIEVDDNAPPELVHVRTGLLPDITHLAYDANTRYAYYTNRDATGALGGHKTLGRLSVQWEDAVVPNGDPRASVIYEAGQVFLDGVSMGRESRALAFVKPDAVAAGAARGQAMVISRLPPALLTVDVSENEDNPGHGTVLRTTEVGTGPSRVTLDAVDGAELAFVSSFTARQIFIIDTRTGLIRSVVPNLSGPFEIAVDRGRQRLYVADFSSSVIRIVSIADLSNREEDGPTTARLEGTLGKPRVVQELE